MNMGAAYELEIYRKTEELIKSLAELPGDNDELRNAAFHYLIKAAQGEEPGEEYKQHVLQFLAMALEGRPPSIQITKPKRRHWFAAMAFLKIRGCTEDEKGKAAEAVAAAFQIEDPDYLLKYLRHKRLINSKLKLRLRSTYQAPPKNR